MASYKIIKITKWKVCSYIYSFGEFVDQQQAENVRDMLIEEDAKKGIRSKKED